MRKTKNTFLQEIVLYQSALAVVTNNPSSLELITANVYFILRLPEGCEQVSHRSSGHISEFRASFESATSVWDLLLSGRRAGIQSHLQFPCRVANFMTIYIPVAKACPKAKAKNL